MASNHTSLDAAANDRKARLAKLASLKRKRSEHDAPDPEPTLNQAEDQNEERSITSNYLSGRNYDIESQGPKLGFENNPAVNSVTLENQAEEIARSTAEKAAQDEQAAAESGLDLFKLQPRKPNWDLKRDLDEKMKVLNVRTKNAITRLVRERIENAQKSARETGQDVSDEKATEDAGIDGTALAEAVHMREKEGEEERVSETDEEDRTV